ncbi:MAG: carboxypeptidase regulatory-like domain-containing protein, partial [Acidobacteria bacterium]|nr:carboxypeptidase regulatory-like domain-containing protein [Acidobacteriota bacterium]
MMRPSSIPTRLLVTCSLVVLAKAPASPQSTDPATLERRASVPAIGQRRTFIQGRVFDASSNEPVYEARVTLTRPGAPSRHTTTDPTGTFLFPDLPPGTYEVEASAPGFGNGREYVQVGIGPNSGVFINLQPRQEAAKPAISEPLSAEEQLAPDEAKDLYKKGAEAFRQRRLEESRAHFEEAIRLFPRFASAHSGLGVVLLQLREVAGAQASFEAAIEINPNFAPPRVYLGALHNASRRYQEAVEHLRTAIVLRPNSWMAHFELSRSFWALGDIDKAENHALRAHELQKRV